MNKYLMMSAAALLATTAAANAGSDGKTSHATVQLNGFCNLVNLSWSGNVYQEQYDGRACSSGFVGGWGLSISGKVKGLGKGVYVDFVTPEPDNQSLALFLSTPIKNGGAWTLYDCFGGGSCTAFNSGTYSVTKGARSKSGSPSAISGVAEKLKALRGN